MRMQEKLYLHFWYFSEEAVLWSKLLLFYHLISFMHVKILTTALISNQGILKGESGLFLTPVLTLWGGGRIDILYGGELLYLRIWHDHSAQSAHFIVTAWVTTRSIYMRAWFKLTGEKQLTLNEIAWRAELQKIRRYNNSPPYPTARWSPQQIPPLNFLVSNLHESVNCLFSLVFFIWIEDSNYSSPKCQLWPSCIHMMELLYVPLCYHQTVLDLGFWS